MLMVASMEREWEEGCSKHREPACGASRVRAASTCCNWNRVQSVQRAEGSKMFAGDVSNSRSQEGFVLRGTGQE